MTSYGQLVVLDVGDEELHVVVFLAGLLDHARRDVDADLARTGERGDEVTEAAADLEHARARHDEAADEALQLLEVVPAHAGLALADLGELVVARHAPIEPRLLARRELGPEPRLARVLEGLRATVRACSSLVHHSDRLLPPPFRGGGLGGGKCGEMLEERSTVPSPH